MTGLSRSPRLVHGALVGIDPANPAASIIVFQYNPESLTRTVTPYAFGERDIDPGEQLRLKGPPQELISLTIELDAVEQLSGPDLGGRGDLHGALAALEMLITPKAAIAVTNEVLRSFGVLQLVPATAPLTLFVWGKKRVVPVRVGAMTITEESFDPELNPIRAKVGLQLEVLSYEQLGLLSPGGALSLAQQVVKEAMATVASMHTASAVRAR
jgi:hypothetical protein